MVRKTEHLKLRVILGYVSILVLAISAIIYVANLITRIVREEKRDDPAREKAHIVTNTLFLLYECETYTHFVGATDEEFGDFNQALDKVFEQLQLLNSYSTDSSQWQRISDLELLLEQKRENTQQLLMARQEMKQLYDKHLAEGMAAKREIAKELELQTQTETQSNTLILQRQKKGFFKRLAEAFVPIKADTTIVTNSTSRQQTDSLVNMYNPSDTIINVLRKLQTEIDAEYELLNLKLNERTTELGINSNIITGKINQILFEIEQDELNTFLRQEAVKENIISDALKHLAVIALLSILIILVFLFLILQDISRGRYYRKQLEMAKQFAEDLLQSRENFMLMISHDIRAPLSSILGYTDLLKQGQTEEAPEHYLDHITLSSKHILSLVNDLLDFHRLESGKMEIRSTSFSVPALFEEIYAGFKPLVDEKKLIFRLETNYPDEPWGAVGDPIRIRQAVGNLLSNAIKFTPEGTVWMNVRAEYTGEKEICLYITIKDEGPGIPETERENIFGEFTRLAGAEKIEGFGLGLSITYKLVSLMGGSISLQSNVGEGSEFTIQLPLPVPAGQLLAPTEEASLPVELNRNINCLVIDDDILQLKLTGELLKRRRVNVVGTSNPEDAIELLKTASFDIILTDIQMPLIDGYSLLKYVRSSGIAGTENIPIIALSASLAEEKEHYVQAGFSGFLNKPFTSEELITLFNELFPQNLQMAAPPINVAALTAFAEDDEEATKAILKTFSEETLKSVALLGEALKNEDRTQASKVSHKLIPLFTMLETHELVAQLRVLEENTPTLSATDWQQTLGEVINQITTIVEKIMGNNSTPVA
jgi:signal transduction histidine kinase/DNA-binding response OmpR family regulator